MPHQPEKHWITVARSQFPWEQEAMDFVYERFPAQDNYRAWSNFEFVADDGSINEVDLLVVGPWGVFLIEIKSSPGTVYGDGADWTWSREGRRKTVDNPIHLANRKCKRLKSLLSRQKAFKKVGVPFIEALVFLSHPDVETRLPGTSGYFVRTRAGIMDAITKRVCPGLKELDRPSVDRPRLRALVQAMTEAGIRPSQQSRRVGDFQLEELLFDSPLGIYQDWSAKHSLMETTRRVARIYMVSRQASETEREIIRNAARREFQITERLEHPNVLKSDPPSECEYGPTLFFRRSPESQRLDHFLRQVGDGLSIDDRLDILRQIAETIGYAHGRNVVHRSLSPQSVLIDREDSGRLIARIFNWQTGGSIAEDDSSGRWTRVSATLHAGQLIEDPSLVYLAPESTSGNADGGPEMDVFSLGALAYLLFSGKDPASSVAALQEKLRTSGSGGLNIRESMDGALDSLVETVNEATRGNASARASVADFLVGLDMVVDELTRPEEEEVIFNPLDANRGDLLPGGFLLEKRLGSGSVSVVFQVGKDGRSLALKVARNAEYNDRIREEYETLQAISEKVPSRLIVAPGELYEFGDRLGFTMELAGERNLASFLREEGALDLTFLERFGEDLIETIRQLDSVGIAHRDIKPSNLGVRASSSKFKRLCLFDFSLSNASPEDIRVGTPAYLDPFIAERKVKRWDISSECFSVAMTLHEMATGSLPTWGDGKSDPASVAGEVNIHPERFDPDLRDRYTEFFRKALARDFRERYDTPDELLAAWKRIFESVDERKRTSVGPVEDESAGDLDGFDLPERVTAGTQLVLLGLSTRLLNALDRLGLVTVADLLGYPLRRIYKLPNVGNKTRRELGGLVKALRERLPEFEIDPVKAIEVIEDGAAETQEALATVDTIARQVAIIGRGKDRRAEQDILQAFLGWNRPKTEDVTRWPTQSELASRLPVTRQRVGHAVMEARERWRRFSSVTALRDSVNEILLAESGVVSNDELIHAVLAARGSAFDDPQSLQMASVAVRAAIETERGMKEPRFLDYRSEGRIFVAVSTELKAYALGLGDLADKLAAEDPLPSSGRALESLRSLKLPEAPEGVAAPTDQRLYHLAVAASKTAALSSRMEIYPVGLEARRALMLAQNALFGKSLTVDEIRSRVAARVPKAEPVPGRPELDRLIREIGLDLEWRDDDKEGGGAYDSPDADGGTVYTTESVSTRRETRIGPAPIGVETTPGLAEARAIEDKLLYGAETGSYLVLTYPPRGEPDALAQLRKPRYRARILDGDALFIDAMREQAKAAGADWNVVLKADAAEPNSPDWRNLQMLVERCVPQIKSKLCDPNETIVIHHVGLFARYDQMSLLGELSAEVGRSDTTRGLWILIPANEASERPTLNHKAVPLSNPAQHVRLNRDWLANKHKG